MAVKVQFTDLIKSMSGTISKKRLPDGSIRRLVVKKNGYMYETTTYPRKGPADAKTIAKQNRFGLISKAFTVLRQEMLLSSDPATRKQVYAVLGAIYDKLLSQGKEVTSDKLMELYAYLYW